jgi:hypothetical protein
MVMKLKTHAQVVDLWPSARELAEDIDEKPFTTQKWRTRNRIPDRAWKRVVEAAQSRQYPVTIELLASIAAERRVH